MRTSYGSANPANPPNPAYRVQHDFLCTSPGGRGFALRLAGPVENAASVAGPLSAAAHFAETDAIQAVEQLGSVGYLMTDQLSLLQLIDTEQGGLNRAVKTGESGNRPGPTLERVAFKTSRLADFVGQRELTAQTGHAPEDSADRHPEGTRRQCPR